MSEYINPAIGFFILFSIGLVTLYLKNRIKNLATGHDVKELTRKTEEVKKEFADKAEALKFQLNLVSQHTLSLKNAEMEAIFNLNKAYTGYMLMLINFDFNDYLYFNYRELDSIHESIKTKHHEIIIHHAHIKLFIGGNEFESAHGDFKEHLLKYAQVTADGIMKIIAIYDIFSVESKKYEKAEDKKAHFEQTKVNIKSKILEAERKRESISENLLQQHEIFTKYLNNRLTKILQ